MEHYPSLNEFHKSENPLSALGLGSCLPKQFEAMNSLFLFLYNFDYDFISKVWGGTFLEDHLKSKLEGKNRTYQESVRALASFIGDLDTENRNLLFAYIIERHKK